MRFQINLFFYKNIFSYIHFKLKVNVANDQLVCDN